MKRNVVFLRRLAAPNRLLGAAYMRGDQLVEMIRPHLEADYALWVMPFHAGLLRGPAMNAFAYSIPRDAIIIFVKSAARGLTRGHLESLRKRGAIIGFDSVDTPVGEIPFDLFDFHIAASISGQRAMQRQLHSIGADRVPAELLLHHADPRLRRGGVPNHDRFRCGYVGQPENMWIPEDLRPEIEILYLKYPSEFARIIDQIRSLSLHYAARPAEQNSNSQLRAFKPFTKGAIAAACGANIFVQMETDDAVELLGKDYPYLVDGRNGESIRGAFLRAKSDFGGKTWLEGLERMRQLDAAVSSEALAGRMREILYRVSELRGN